MSEKVYCKYCGTSASSVHSLVVNKCPRHPAGPYKGPHVLYQGGEKPQYVCEYCGTKASSIHSLVVNKCPRHPDGPYKGYHSPAL